MVNVDVTACFLARSVAVAGTFSLMVLVWDAVLARTYRQAAGWAIAVFLCAWISAGLDTGIVKPGLSTGARMSAMLASATTHLVIFSVFGLMAARDRRAKGLSIVGPDRAGEPPARSSSP
jgi:hypothetical protein